MDSTPYTFSAENSLDAQISSLVMGSFWAKCKVEITKKNTEIKMDLIFIKIDLNDVVIN
jgi:hypothetical protein